MKRDTSRRSVVAIRARIPDLGSKAVNDNSTATPTDIQMLKISSILKDPRLQHRAVIDRDVVAEWANLIRGGTVFPAITVWFDGEQYWLSDGFHRIAATERAELSEISAEIRQGGFADAQWDSYAVNATHGLRRSRTETEAVIQAALQHTKGATLSNVEVAKHLHVAEGTIRYWRKKLSSQVRDDKVRVVTRGGTTYELNTRRIGTSGRGQHTTSRRSLQLDLASMKESSSPTVRRLLIIIEHWVLGQADPTRCLDGIERFVRGHRTDVPQLSKALPRS